MSFRQDLALALSPDLRDLARRIEEVEKALGVNARNLTEAGTRGRWVMVDDVRDDLIESQARLVEVLGILTGRRPNRG